MTGNELLEELRRASRSKKIPTAEKINLVLATLADLHEKQNDIEKQIGYLSDQIGTESSKTRDWVNEIKKEADVVHAGLDDRLDTVEQRASTFGRMQAALTGLVLAVSSYLAALR